MRRQQAEKLLRLLPVPLFRKALRAGAAAAVEHMALLRSLELRTVVDVGANVGQFALAIAFGLVLLAVAFAVNLALALARPER